MLWIIFVFATEHLQQVEIILNVVFAENHFAFSCFFELLKLFTIEVRYQYGWAAVLPSIL
jgi:hypothetical protein